MGLASDKTLQSRLNPHGKPEQGKLWECLAVVGFPEQSRLPGAPWSALRYFFVRKRVQKYWLHLTAGNGHIGHTKYSERSRDVNMACRAS